MTMENFSNLGKKIGRKVGIGIMAATSLVGSAEASQLDIAKAQTVVTMAEFKFNKAKAGKDKEKAEEALVLAQAKLEEARAKNADKQDKKMEKNSRPTLIGPDGVVYGSSVGFTPGGVRVTGVGEGGVNIESRGRASEEGFRGLGPRRSK